MSRTAKVAIVLVLATVVVAVLILKNAGSAGTTAPRPAQSDTHTVPLPRLVDLGSVTCIPCKMMTPVLEEIRKQCAGKLAVEFIDVKENPDAGLRCGVKLIPTQIFYDASGAEIFRHEGFFAKADILAKWKDLGVDVEPGRPAERK